MKAPNKIYIETNAGEAFSSKWTTIPFRDFENTEYIRKDALLEWINTAKNSLLMDTKAPHLGKVGSLATLDALIDMLNEM